MFLYHFWLTSLAWSSQGRKKRGSELRRSNFRFPGDTTLIPKLFSTSTLGDQVGFGENWFWWQKNHDRRSPLSRSGWQPLLNAADPGWVCFWQWQWKTCGQKPTARRDRGRNVGFSSSSGRRRRGRKHQSGPSKIDVFASKKINILQSQTEMLLLGNLTFCSHPPLIILKHIISYCLATLAFAGLPPPSPGAAPCKASCLTWTGVETKTLKNEIWYKFWVNSLVHINM